MLAHVEQALVWVLGLFRRDHGHAVTLQIKRGCMGRPDGEPVWPSGKALDW